MAFGLLLLCHTHFNYSTISYLIVYATPFNKVKFGNKPYGKAGSPPLPVTTKEIAVEEEEILSFERF